MLALVETRTQNEYWVPGGNIDDVGIPFQIICNRYTKVFDDFNIFQYFTPKGVRNLDFNSWLFH